jgi:hypothetical protein
MGYGKILKEHFHLFIIVSQLLFKCLLLISYVLDIEKPEVKYVFVVHIGLMLTKL